jgi:itaconate CoA-transferase
MFATTPTVSESLEAMSKDLEGLLVVSLEQAVAAPYASCKLADAGARVIKLERSDGDFARGYDRYVNGQSAYFVWLNRGKESVCVDIKNAEDKAFIGRLLADADIFIQNLAPGAAERAGFGSDDLRAKYPRLITCDISGYGMEGPYRDMKAYDFLIQGESGLAMVTGTPESGARVGVSVCDIAAGMYSYQAILEALFSRERTGKGRGIQVSLFHALADWMNVPFLQYHYGNHTPARSGLNHPTIAPYGAYECKGGAMILISIQNPREWKRLCEDILSRPDLVEHPSFATTPARVANRPELDKIINEVFGTMDRDVVADKLFDAAIAFGRLSSLEDLVNHPQARHIKVQTSAGEVKVLAPPAVLDEPREGYGAVPDLGADTDRVKREFQVG